MRILHLIDHLGCGGAQTLLADMLAQWPNGADFIQVLGLGRPNALRERIASLPNVQAICLGRHRWDPFVVSQAARRAVAGDWDVVHAHLNKSILSLMAAGPQLAGRRVIHLHGDPTCDAGLGRLLRWSGSRMDRVIAVSRSTADAAARVGAPSDARLVIIQNGVDVQRVERGANENTTAPQPAGLLPKEPRFVLAYVGRLDRGKGIDDLIRAIPGLDSRVRVDLIGDGRDRGRLQTLARDLNVANRVRFVGYQNNAPAWISAADAIVLPSRTEGLPITLLEAFCLGTPVIATRVGGVQELVEDGYNGCCIEPGDVTGLRKAAEKLMHSREHRQTLARNALRTLRTSFTAGRMAQRVRQVYLELAPSVRKQRLLPTTA